MSRDVARAAAQWLALLESGAATERDHAALQHWRDSHPQHEQTWQKAQALRLSLIHISEPTRPY